MDTRLPFEPETEDQIFQRFGPALFPMVPLDDVFAGRLPRPGTQRRHVFDFQDGMRMIASTDFDRTHCFVHLSFSSCVTVKNKAEYLAFSARMQERVCRLADSPTITPVATETTAAAIHLYFQKSDFSKYMPEQAAVTVTE